MTEENKGVIQQALTELLSTRDEQTLGAWLSDDFVHHRPDGSSTRAEWLEAVREALVPLADMQLEIQHLLAEGDHVVMHSRRWLPTGPTIAVVNIWRFEEGLITEAWEIIEPQAAATTNLTWWDPPRSA